MASFLVCLAVTLEHSADHPARHTPAHQDQHREQHEDHVDLDSFGRDEILMLEDQSEDQSLGPRWASASISTEAPSGSPATPIVDLAGRCSPKPFT